MKQRVNLLLVNVKKIVLALGEMTIFLSFVTALTKQERQEVHSQNILSRT